MPGSFGASNNDDGAVASTASSTKSGLFARNDATVAAAPGQPGGNGVFALSMVPNASGVFGANNNGGIGVAGTSERGVGVLGRGRIAARFEGDVEVTGDVRLVNHGDCAEDFGIAEADTLEPGAVMVIDDRGVLCPSRSEYDKRVAGVVSGAGGYKPEIVLDSGRTDEPRVPVALMGKVYCKVDAQYSAIDVGDLLTTSRTPGHAMKAADPARAFGSVIGKALRPHREGRGLIPILVALQ